MASFGICHFLGIASPGLVISEGSKLRGGGKKDESPCINGMVCIIDVYILTS